MKNKLISLILLIAMLISNVLPVNSFAQTVSTEADPEVISAMASSWTGTSPKEGDSIFYVEAIGYNLNDLEAVVSRDGYINENNAVALENNKWFLGYTSIGEERYVYEMLMMGESTLESNIYYIQLMDEEGNYYKPDFSGYFGVDNYPFLNIIELPIEMSSSNVSVPFKMDIQGIAGELNYLKDNILIDLYVGTKESFWDDPVLIEKVGTMNNDGFEIVQIGGDAYYIEGTLDVESELQGGETLFVVVTVDEETISSRNTIHVAPETGLGQFKLSNALKASTSYGEHEGMGNYEAADDTLFYIGNPTTGSSVTAHKFTITGGNIKNASLLTVVDDKGNNILKSNSVSVNKSDFGIYTVTGVLNIGEDSNKIVVKYDENIYHETPIDRTDVSGAVSANIIDYEFKYGSFSLPRDTTEFQVALSNINIPVLGDYSAVLINDNDTIDIEYNYEFINGELVFNIQLDNPLEGYYNLELSLDGVNISKLEYYDGIIYDEYPVNIGISFGEDEYSLPDAVPPALTNIYGSRELSLMGTGFSQSKNYTACFKVHSINGLSSSPMEYEAEFVSENKLYISRDITDNLARGWYEVYLKEDGIRINGFADAVLLPVTDIEEVINPTVIINDGEVATFEQTVNIGITEGTFSMMRFSENENELSSLPYVDIVSNVPYELSEGYGKKTIYFEFKADNDNIYKTSATISYLSQEFPAPTLVGIVGLEREGENPVSVHKFNSHSLYVQTEGAYTAKVDLVDEFDNIVETYELKLTSINKINTYSKAISFDNDNVVKLRFYLIDGQNRMSNYNEIPVRVIIKPYISFVKTDLATSYIGMSRYVHNKSEIVFNMKSKPGYDGKAIIKYKNGADEERFSETVLSEDGAGTYSAKVNVPVDAAYIESVEYKLQDKLAPDNLSRNTEVVGLNVASAIKFTNLPNTGDFNGKILQLNGLASFPKKTIYDKQSEIVFNNLPPGSYNYYLSDYTNIYKSGTVVVNKGSESLEDLSDSKKPASFTFMVTDEEGSDIDISKLAYIYYVYSVNGSYGYGYAYPNTKITGLVEGAKIVSYQLRLPYEYLKKYEEPVEIIDDIELTAGENIEEIKLKEIPMINLKVTVKDKNVTDRVIPGVEINFSQNAINGSNSFYYSKSNTTDENGIATLNIYDSEKFYLVANKENYHQFSETYDNSFNRDEEIVILLDYSDQNRIKLNSYSLPLSEEELGEESDLLENQEAVLGLKITDMEGNDIYTSKIGNNTYSFRESLKDKTIRVYPYVSERYTNKQEFYEVNMNEYGNGSVDVVSLPKGIIKASLINSEEPESTPYMLIYQTVKGYDTEKLVLVSSITGADNIVSSINNNLDDGNYTVVLFCSNELKDIRGLSNIDVFKENGLVENYHYVKKDVVVKSGKITNLGEIKLEELVKESMLSPLKVTYTTQFVSTSLDGSKGEIHVKARIAVNQLIKKDLKLTSITALGDGFTTPSSKKVNGVEHQLGFGEYEPDDEGNYTVTYMLNSTTDKIVNKIYFGISGTIKDKPYYYYDYINVETPYVTINAPKQVVLPKSEIIVRGKAFAGSKIEIYDGDILTGVTTADSSHNYEIPVMLTSPNKPAVHNLYAKMITKDEKEFTTKIVTTEIINGAKTAHISDFQFINVAHNWNLDDPNVQLYSVESIGDNPGGAYAYNPNGISRITFTINNLNSSQLEEVCVINTDKNGFKTKYPATLVKDDINGKYSDWIVEEKLGYWINNISVFYSLKDETDMGVLTGFNNPSLEEFKSALNNINKIEPASIPKEYRDNKGAEITEESATTLKAHKEFADGKIGIEVNYTETSGISESSLISQGFRKIPVGNDGEFYLIKDSSTINGINMNVKRTMYLSEGLNAMVSEGNSVAVKGINLASVDTPKLYASTKDTVRDISGKVDFVGYVEGGGEIAYEAFKKKAADLGKVGTGLQAVGGITTAIQIFSGPASLDPANLSSLLHQIKDVNFSSRMYKEIKEYQIARIDSHAISSLMGTVSYGSSFFSLPGKCLSFVISTGNMVYTDSIDAEYNLWGNALLSEIMMQLRKEEQDVGKEDDPEDPKWIMDPSGYVFEAVKTQRVEGIRATAQTGETVQTETGDIEFWNDWNDDILTMSNQENPMYTDIDGKYGWDVPVGNWRVMFEDDKNTYQTTTSKSMTVPPAHMEVNIGLLSNKAPQVKTVAVNPTCLEIEFDSYMLPDSIYDAESGYVNIRIFETKSDLFVPFESIEFIEPAKNDGYIKNDAYQNDVIDSETFVKKVRIAADESLYPGGFRIYEDDGITPKKYTVEVSPNVMSYSNVPMDSKYVKAVETSLRQSVQKPSASLKAGSYAENQTVSLSVDTEGAEIYYTNDGSIPTINSRKYVSPIVIFESCTLKAVAKKAGMDDSSVFEATYLIGDVSAENNTEDPDDDEDSNGSGNSKDKNKNKDTNTDLIIESKEFKDVLLGSWYYDGVKFVVEKGLFKGISEDEFGPNYNMTRAMLVTVLYRLEGATENNSTSSFKDVEKSSWYEQPVIWAIKNNLVLGYNQDIFGVNDSITREQLAAILYRYATFKGYDINKTTNLDDFTDNDKISPWALDAIQWMVGNNILKGKGNNIIDPLGSATRAEIAVIMQRFIETMCR